VSKLECQGSQKLGKLLKVLVNELINVGRCYSQNMTENILFT